MRRKTYRHSEIQRAILEGGRYEESIDIAPGLGEGRLVDAFVYVETMNDGGVPPIGQETVNRCPDCGEINPWRKLNSSPRTLGCGLRPGWQRWECCGHEEPKDELGAGVLDCLEAVHGDIVETFLEDEEE